MRQDTRKHTRHCLRPDAAAVEAYLANPGDSAYRRFAAKYERTLRERFTADRGPFDALAALARAQDVYLGCSCPTKKNPVERCHTTLALSFMAHRYPDLAIKRQEQPPVAFDDPAVAEAFDGFAPAIRPGLLALRALIIRTAAQCPDLGGIEETLKWGQPSYLTRRPNTGSTVRLGDVCGDEQQYALYVHCQSALAATFRSLYADTLRFDGNRAVLFHVDEPLPAGPVSHCIQLALTYHRWKGHPRRLPKPTT